MAAESIEDLRVDLRLMLRQRLTPADFGLAVRKHPNSLLITARNKMKNAQSVNRVVSLAGRNLETTRLNVSSKDRASAQNRATLQAFMERVSDAADYNPTRRGWHRWRRVERSEVADFLDEYIAAPVDAFFSGSALSGWARRAKARRFSTWDVVVAQGQSAASAVTLGGKSSPVVTRKLERAEDIAKVSGSRLRLAGPSDVEGLLPAETVDALVEEYTKEFPEAKRPRETYFYKALERPVLLAYPLRDEHSDHEYLVALKIAIPGDPTDVNNHDGEVEYVINTVAQEQWLSEFTDADDQDLDD
jgi:hypothetical protein